MKSTLAIAVPVLAFLLVSGWAQEEVPPPAPEVFGTLDRMANPGGPDENGWALYQHALGEVTDPPPGPRLALPGTDAWIQVVPWLEENRDLVPVLLRASRRRCWGSSHDPVAHNKSWRDYYRGKGDEARAKEYQDKIDRIGPTPSAASASTPNLLQARSLCNLLILAAREAEAAGKPRDAMHDVLAANRMGRHLLDRCLLIDQAIGCALLSISAKEFRRLITANASAWTEDDLASWSRSSACRGPVPRVREAIEGELIAVKDMVRQLLEAPPGQKGFMQGESHDLMNRLNDALSWELHANAADTLWHIDDLTEKALAAAEGASPWKALQRVPDANESFSGFLTKRRYAIVRALDPGHLIRMLFSMLQQVSSEYEANRIVVTLVRARQEAGRYPAELPELDVRFVYTTSTDGSAFTLKATICGHEKSYAP